MKNNKVPKGLVVLESAFDNQDRIISNAKGDKPQELEEINLGTADCPKNVSLPSIISTQALQSSSYP